MVVVALDVVAPVEEVMAAVEMTAEAEGTIRLGTGRTVKIIPTLLWKETQVKTIKKINHR